MTAVTVAIATFRRASVHETLASLAAQALPAGVTLEALVADNDEAPAAREAIAATARALGLPVAYVHAPARNISLARNAALDHARTRLVAFLDDDETADPGWLAALLSARAESGADVVLGPVLPVYGPGTPRWMREGDFHATHPAIARGRILTGYAGNVLIDTDAPALRGRRFRLDLGRSGGEDTDFFHRVVRAGARIAHAPDAVARERVPPERATVRWLAARRFRSGQSHALVLVRDTARPAARMGAAGIAAAKCGACAACALVLAPSARRLAFWSLRATLHAGVAARLLGVRERAAYGVDTADDAR